MAPKRQVLGDITNTATAKKTDAVYTEAFRILYHFQKCYREFYNHNSSELDMDLVIDEFFRDAEDGFQKLFCYYTTSQNLSYHGTPITPAEFVELGRDLIKWLRLLSFQCKERLNSHSA